MSLTRRNLLHTAALTGAATLLPRFLLAQTPGPNGGFPPQTQIDADALRPRYHLAPAHGWMNDPCAPIFYNDRYHLFFQNNPLGSTWGNISWAHAVSKDMVHWSMRPVALQPTPGGPDSFGVFTGSMVFDGKIPTILYTCVSPSTPEQATLWNSHPPEREAQCIATRANSLAANTTINGRPPTAEQLDHLEDAALDTWDRGDKPVIAAPPPGMKVTGFRDPVPWREDDGNFYLLLASGQKGIGGNVLLYKSPDLRQWKYQGIFAEGKSTGMQTDDTVDSGETWECPDFFPLGGKHVLIHSAGTLDGRRTMWQSGTLDKRTMKWTPEKEGVLNHGPYYAPKTQIDAHGNRILWGWIPETWSEAEGTTHGWSGCMSLPRVLTLVNGEIRFAPAPEVSSLRGTMTNSVSPSLSLKGAQHEIVLQLVRGNAKRGVSFRAQNEQCALLEVLSVADETKFYLNQKVIDASLSSPQELTLRVFVDHSLFEIFVGDLLVLTDRVYCNATARSETQIRVPRGYELKSVVNYPLSGS